MAFSFHGLMRDEQNLRRPTPGLKPMRILKNGGKYGKLFPPHMQSHLKEWEKEKSAKKKAGELPKDKIALLDQIEFPWDRY